MAKTKVIKVPDVPGPMAKLCYKQAETMERCMIKKGHRGLHDWEMRKKILELEGQLDYVRELIGH